MGILNKDEIKRRLAKGELLVKARKKDGDFDIEPDSYDLSAGTAIWKSRNQNDEFSIERRSYDSSLPLTEQPSVTVQPGQMIFVITHEDIKMPVDVSGTVYSRNSIALDGILGLNAGHVDPGYSGPIVIRLINLRANPWTLILGKPIFTIVFETIDYKTGDTLVSLPGYSQEKMLEKVLGTADNALSNALVDLCADEINRRLNEHDTRIQEQLRRDLSDVFLPRNEIWSFPLKRFWAWFIAVIVFLIGLGGIIYTIIDHLPKQ